MVPIDAASSVSVGVVRIVNHAIDNRRHVTRDLNDQSASGQLAGS